MAFLVDFILEKASGIGRLQLLTRNPMFKELQATLAAECNKKAVLYNLFCQDKTTTPLDSSMAAVQEANLQAEFRQISLLSNERGEELQRFYNTQCAEIETQRSDAIDKLKLVVTNGASQYKKDLSAIHLYFDQQRMHLTNRITTSLNLLKMAFPPSLNDVYQSKMKSRQLNSHAVDLMMEWFEQNVHDPYPTDDEKQDLADRGGISTGQVKAWFANKRNRTSNTKPKKHKRIMERNLLNICDEITVNALNSKPRMHGEIIDRLTNLVQGSSGYTPSSLECSPQSCYSDY